MKVLKEAIKRYRRLDDDKSSEEGNASDDVNLDLDDESADDNDENLELDTEHPDQDDQDDQEPSLDVDDNDDQDGDDQDGEDEPTLDIDDEQQEEPQDPNKQGLIRAVKNAHLVYKRETEDGTFEELWLYNVTTLRDELIVRKAILAGTDIPPNKMTSPDGSQVYTMWSAGNAELVLVSGLPN